MQRPEACLEGWLQVRAALQSQVWQPATTLNHVVLLTSRAVWAPCSSLASLPDPPLLPLLSPQPAAAVGAPPTAKPGDRTTSRLLSAATGSRQTLHIQSRGNTRIECTCTADQLQWGITSGPQHTTQCPCKGTCSVLTFLNPLLPKLDIVSTRACASGGSSGRVRCTCRYQQDAKEVFLSVMIAKLESTSCKPDVASQHATQHVTLPVSVAGGCCCQLTLRLSGKLSASGRWLAAARCAAAAAASAAAAALAAFSSSVSSFSSSLAEVSSCRHARQQDVLKQAAGGFGLHQLRLLQWTAPKLLAAQT